MGVGSGEMGGGSGATRLKCHRPVASVRLPERRSRSSKWTWTEDAEKVAVQPELHSWSMDKRGGVCAEGWDYVNAAGATGRLGISSWASWVEYIIVPFGLAIPIGVVVIGHLFSTLAVTVQKCAAIYKNSNGIGGNSNCWGGGLQRTQ